MKPLALFLVYLSTRITVLMMRVLRYIYLPGSNSSHVQYSFASVSIKKKEGGVTSPIRQVFYKHVVVLYWFSPS